MLTIGISKGEDALKKMQRALDAAGTPLQKYNDDALQMYSPCGALHAYLLRTRRVPYLVKEGHLDLGITGEDILEERGPGDCVVLAYLLSEEFGLRATRVALFSAADDSVCRAQDIPSGSTITSEYFRMTHRFFAPRTDLHIDLTPGGSEAEVPLAYRFGVGVVDSGRTLFANNLKEVCTIFTSRPVLVANRKTLADKKKRQEIKRFVRALRIVL